MTPGEVGAMRDVSLDLSQPLIDDLLADICRRVAKAGKITDTAEYEIYRAKALGLSNVEIKKAIARQKGLSSEMIDTLAAYIAKSDSAGAVDTSTRQVLDAYTKVTKSDMNQLMNDMRGVGPDGQIRDLQGTYRSCMDYAFQQVSTGTSDYTTALRKATRYLARRGIRAVVQSNDRAVSLEFATRRTLMNQMGAMDREILDANHDAIGCDGWEISAHSACSPDHEPIQGRQYTDDDYKLLNETLQRPIGMFNCKHVAFPIILGVDSPQYTAAELQAFKDDNAAGVTYQGRHYTMYQATQTQSALENEIRYSKNSILMDRELGDDQKLRDDQIRLGRLRAEYNRFSRTAELPTRNERMQVVDFGHKEASNATAATKKELKSILEAAKKDGTILLSSAQEDLIAEQDFSDIIMLKHKMSNRAVRKWYISHDAGIIAQIDSSLSLEQRAKLAFGLRNQHRTQARDLMADVAAREKLNKKERNAAFDDLVADKMKRKGLSREEALQDILNTSGKTRKSVDESLGLGDS